MANRLGRHTGHAAQVTSEAPVPSPGTVARRLLQNLGRGVRDTALFPLTSRAPREWVVVRLDWGLTEASPVPPWAEGMLQRPGTLANVLDCLDLAHKDPRVCGVLFKLGRASLGWAKLSALERALGRLREAGKHVVVYAESAGNAAAWLGALANHFWMAPEGRLDLLGVRVEAPFVRQALEKLRIRPEVFFAGRYKSAGETLERRSMSPTAREALDEVVEGLYDSLLNGLAQGRAGDKERAREWVDQGPYLASQAKDIGLVDELVYDDELPTRLAAIADETEPSDTSREAHLVTTPAYLRLARPRFRWQPLLGGPNVIAVVPVQGLIGPGAGHSRGVVGQLRRLADSDEVCAVVLRVDSPGGDPLASDLIWRAVKKLTEKKPVVASLGDTAASGGYYVAMAANEIVAETTTLTGSIGVVMLSLEFEGLLETLGVRFDSVERGKHSGIYDPVRPRTEEERAVLKDQVKTLYRSFLKKAADGRGLALEEVEKVAEGRVWTGENAHTRKLVDRLGGLDTALARARELAGIGAEEGRVMHCSPLTSVLSRLLQPSPTDGSFQPLGEAQFRCPVQIRLR
jgi:protease-4